MNQALGLLLAPLIAGYIFLRRTYYFRHTFQQESGYKTLLFTAAFGCLFFSICKLFITPGVATFALWLCPTWVSYWQTHRPSFLTATGLLSIGLAPLGAAFVNLLKPKQAVLLTLLQKDPIPRILADSMTEKSLVLVTLTTRKVYLGTVYGLDQGPEMGRSIMIIPQRSGYRHRKTMKVMFTEFYEELFFVVMRGGKVDEETLKKLGFPKELAQEIEKNEEAMAKYGIAIDLELVASANIWNNLTRDPMGNWTP